MTAPRTTSTGVEVRPVELTDGAGNVVGGAFIGALDGVGNDAYSFAPYAQVFNGQNWDRLRTPKVFKPVDLAAGTAETALWTPAAGKRFRLMGLFLKTGAACKLTLRDGTGGTTIVVLDLDAAPHSLYLGNGLLSAAAGNALTVTRSVSTTLAGMVFGTEE
jgi:hypothetical protein